MAETYAVFLRGINVGGIKIKMADLKEAFFGMGFPDVQTLLASGNVIATAPKEGQSRQALTSSIEHGLSERFGYEAHVLLRDRDEVAAVITAAQAISVPSDSHQYILFCDSPDLPIELRSLFESLAHEAGEQFFLAGQEAIWIVPKGATLASDFGSKVLGNKQYKSRLTSRNINTVEKVLKLMPPEKA